MANNLTLGRSKSKLIFGIAIVGVVIAVAIILFLVFRPEASTRTELPPPPPVTDPLNSLPPVQRFDVFLFDPDAPKLVRVESESRFSQDTTERLKQIIDALVKASHNEFISLIPKGTLLEEAYIDNQLTAYLDFSRHLTEAHMGGTTAELLTISAILNTVKSNFANQVREVQIMIESQQADTIAGHVDISKPLSLMTLMDIP